MQSKKPVKGLRFVASVMNQCFVDRKTVTMKSSLVGIHPLEGGRHMRSPGNHRDSPMTKAVEMFNQLPHRLLVLDSNLAESTGDQSVNQYGGHSILLEIREGPA